MEETVQWINWYEFAPQGDTFLCKVFNQETSMRTEGGLILNTEESKIEDRPTVGIVLSAGPESPYKVDDIVFWRKEAGYDLGMIRSETDKFILMHPQGVIGVKVFDTRKEI